MLVELNPCASPQFEPAEDNSESNARMAAGSISHLVGQWDTIETSLTFVSNNIQLYGCGFAKQNLLGII